GLIVRISGCAAFGRVHQEGTKMRISRTALLATTLLSGVAFANPAFAQANSTTPPVNPQAQPEVNAAVSNQTPATQENAPGTPPAPPRSNEAIVVTGTRISSPNITSLQPVQVVGAQDINRSGAVNVQEVLLQNPAFAAGTTTTNTAFTTSGAGEATIDLRNLGTSRTLVLIDGRRVVGGFGGSPVVDLNNIPTQFLERVDILTGGASSL